MLVSSTRNGLKKDFTQSPQRTQSAGIGEIGFLKNFSGVVLCEKIAGKCSWSRFPLRPGVAQPLYGLSLEHLKNIGYLLFYMY